MTSARRLPARRAALPALVAALAPARAAALLGRLADGREEALSISASLAGAPRRARLAALAAALPRAATPPGPPGTHPLLARLSLERTAPGRAASAPPPAVARPPVRAATAGDGTTAAEHGPVALARRVDWEPA